MHQQDAEGEFFRKIAEQGHYAGRTKPTPTRQGLYLASSDGKLWASINSVDASDVRKMLRKGLARWGAPNSQENLKYEPVDTDKKFEPLAAFHPFPEGGLSLIETMRDLPRHDHPGHKTNRHNFDHVWLTAEEANTFVPKKTETGASFSIDEQVVRRLAQFHFVDQVNGESDPWRPEDVKTAALKGTVTKIDGNEVTIQLTGEARCVQAPTGEVNPFNGKEIAQDRGVDLKIRGWLVYDTSSKSFKRFDILGAGNRWGSALYSFRFRDMGPEPVGFLLELSPEGGEARIRPKFLTWEYFGE